MNRELGEHAIELVEQLRHAREQVAAAKAQEDQARAALLFLLRDVDAGTVNGVPVIQVRRSWPERFDVRAFSAVYPDIRRMFLREATHPTESLVLP